MTIDNPGFGHFPVVDFASRIASAGVSENSAVNVIGSVAAASRSGIRQRLKNVRLFLGDVSREENMFATKCAEDGRSTRAKNWIFDAKF